MKAVNKSVAYIYVSTSVATFSQRSGLCSVSPGAASEAAMDASEAADTKKSWKAMAVAGGGGGGGVFRQSLGGGTKAYPLLDIHFWNRLSVGTVLPHTATHGKGGHIPHRDSEVIRT